MTMQDGGQSTGSYSGENIKALCEKPDNFTEVY